MGGPLKFEVRVGGPLKFEVRGGGPLKYEVRGARSRGKSPLDFWLGGGGRMSPKFRSHIVSKKKQDSS